MLYFAHRNLHRVICIPKNTFVKETVCIEARETFGCYCWLLYTTPPGYLLLFPRRCIFPTKGYVLYDALKIKANISCLYTRAPIPITTQAKSFHTNNLQLFTKELVMITLYNMLSFYFIPCVLHKLLVILTISL